MIRIAVSNFLVSQGDERSELRRLCQWHKETWPTQAMQGIGEAFQRRITEKGRSKTNCYLCPIT